jgi:hypothetical protein
MMDTLHTVLRSIQIAPRPRLEFLDHLDRITKQRARTRSPRAKTNGETRNRKR